MSNRNAASSLDNSANPAFAAVLSQFVYGKPISKAKWLCLIPVIGGVFIFLYVSGIPLLFSAALLYAARPQRKRAHTAL